MGKLFISFLMSDCFFSIIVLQHFFSGNMKNLFVLLFYFSATFTVYGQEVTQTIRGSIKDKDSKYNLIGAAVSVYQNNDLITGGTSDVDGYFRIEKIPLGRYTLVISFLGYGQTSIPNVIVNAGKEIVLNIEMEESINHVGKYFVDVKLGHGFAGRVKIKVAEEK